MLAGLISLSCKPYHSGHDGLIRMAAKECDFVEIYVSVLNRARTGEIPIFGDTMQMMWDEYITKSLPENVEVHLVNGSPVQEVFRRLGEADIEDDGLTKFRLYADVKDASETWKEKYLIKCCPKICSTERLEVIGVPRDNIICISGTDMRQFIQHGDKESFIRYVPETLDGEMMWDKLHADLNRKV